MKMCNKEEFTFPNSCFVMRISIWICSEKTNAIKSRCYDNRFQGYEENYED